MGSVERVCVRGGRFRLCSISNKDNSVTVETLRGCGDPRGGRHPTVIMQVTKAPSVCCNEYKLYQRFSSLFAVGVEGEMPNHLLTLSLHALHEA